MYVKVKVVPSSRKEKIFWIKEREAVIEIKEKPLRGEVNRRVTEIISSIFPQKRVKLVKGQKSKSKIFKIDE